MLFLLCQTDHATSKPYSISCKLAFRATFSCPFFLLLFSLHLGLLFAGVGPKFKLDNLSVIIVINSKLPHGPRMQFSNKPLE